MNLLNLIELIVIVALAGVAYVTNKALGAQIDLNNAQEQAFNKEFEHQHERYQAKYKQWADADDEADRNWEKYHNEYLKRIQLAKDLSERINAATQEKVVLDIDGLGPCHIMPTDRTFQLFDYLKTLQN